MALTPEEPFSQTRADAFEEEARDRLGYYPGHSRFCPERRFVPFTQARCGCGPRPPLRDLLRPLAMKAHWWFVTIMLALLWLVLEILTMPKYWWEP